MSAPTLINLPPPPSDPVTPSDLGPGTPNSGTTSLSALSTTAIKDGHKGHAPPHTHGHASSSGSNSSTNTLDAERADRISRLAGLERVATVRQGGNGPTSHFASGATVGPTSQQPPQGYFDAAGTTQGKERSTVGSASATGSVGARTTWASGSDVFDADKMSEDQDDAASNNTGLSDEANASLVGFGEAASSTISGPVSTPVRNNAGGVASPTTSKGPHHLARDSGSPMQGVKSERAKMLDGMTYDSDVVDTTSSADGATYRRNANMTGQETAERIVRERLDEGESQRQTPFGATDAPQGKGRF